MSGHLMGVQCLKVINDGKDSGRVCKQYSKQGRIWALQRVKSSRNVKNRLDLNKMPIFLAADFATEEMGSFQERSDTSETPFTHLQGI